jgi:hypothetical protein
VGQEEGLNLFGVGKINIHMGIHQPLVFPLPVYFGDPKIGIG